MKKTHTAFSFPVLFCFLLLSMSKAGAQNQPATDTSGSTTFKPHGVLWGYAFGDYAFKADADTVGGGRGGSNQYSKMLKDNSLFQFRRVYLGYNYDISEKFSAEFLLAAEDMVAGGDLLGDGKFAPYVKLANVRWKKIYPGADLVFGLVSTPSFSPSSEPVWGYRSIERTVADVRRTPSFDLGIAIQGKFIPNNDNYGYNVMIGNGSSAKPETDKFKAFYGDVYAKFFKKQIIVDLYADYQRLAWSPGFHRDRRMVKGFVAYTTPKFTIGVEAFVNTLRADATATRTNGNKDTIDTKASAISVFVKGRLYKDRLGFFARFDTYNPSLNNDNIIYSAYSPMTSQYDPNTKERFITAGLDYTPVKNVHIMPNIWFNGYRNTTKANVEDGNDMVYRLTLYYIYGK